MRHIPLSSSLHSKLTIWSLQITLVTGTPNMAHPHSRLLHRKLAMLSLQNALAAGTHSVTQAPTAHLQPAQKEEALPPPADSQDHSAAALRADRPRQLALAPLAELPGGAHLQQGRPSISNNWPDAVQGVTSGLHHSLTLSVMPWISDRVQCASKGQPR